MTGLPTPTALALPGDALTLVHEDAAFVVLDKPAGLLAVPGRGPDKQDCLSARAQQRWPDALIVHRLDMATSGLIVMARGIEKGPALGAALRAAEEVWIERGFSSDQSALRAIADAALRSAGGRSA